jgi:hypothetical protein
MTTIYVRFTAHSIRQNKAAPISLLSLSLSKENSITLIFLNNPPREKSNKILLGTRKTNSQSQHKLALSLPLKTLALTPKINNAQCELINFASPLTHAQLDLHGGQLIRYT